MHQWRPADFRLYPLKAELLLSMAGYRESPILLIEIAGSGRSQAVFRANPDLPSKRLVRDIRAAMAGC